MDAVRNKSTAAAAPERLDLSPRLLFEAARRAEAMGLVEPGAVARADVTSVRHLANRVRRAGIAAGAAEALNNVAVPTAAEVRALLEMMVAALEASPVPKVGRAGPRGRFAPGRAAAASEFSRPEHAADGGRRAPHPGPARRPPPFPGARRRRPGRVVQRHRHSPMVPSQAHEARPPLAGRDSHR